MSPIAMLPAGSVLTKYRITAVLGHGGFGVTYAAEDLALGGTVAIKQLVPRSTDGRRREIDRFLERARLLARVEHRNVIKVRAFFEANDTAYQVMEFVDGGTLQARLATHPWGLPADEVRMVIGEVADGLSELHRLMILHRDIKPANVLLRRSLSAVITDFGTARFGDDAAEGLTPGYAAPEQYRARGGEGPWTDIYGLGALGYALLTGSPPPGAPDRLRGAPLINLHSDAADHDLARAIHAALSLEANQRPGSIAEWRLSLSGGLRPMVAAARPPSPLDAPPAAAVRSWAGNLAENLAVGLRRFFGARTLEERPLPSGEIPTPPSSTQGPPTLSRPIDGLEPSTDMVGEPMRRRDSPDPLGDLASRDHGPPPAAFGEDWTGAARTPTTDGFGEAVVSVFAPDRVATGDTAMVQVFLHLHEQTAAALSAALLFDDAAVARGAHTLAASIPPGTAVQLTLALPGLMVEPAFAAIIWNRRPESAQFSVSVPASHKGGTVIGTVRVLLDGTPIGELRFTIKLLAGAAAGATYMRAAIDARRYRRAFASYASDDRAEVLRRVQILRRVGVEVFQDVLDLEPGQRWEGELYRRIDECDVVLLFWSRAARDSVWVAREIDYALARQRRERISDDAADLPAIEPLPIEGPPIPEPPERLKHLHFNDALLYAIAGEDRLRDR